MDTTIKKRAINKKLKEVSELDSDSYTEKLYTEREVVSKYHIKSEIKIKTVIKYFSKHAIKGSEYCAICNHFYYSFKTVVEK